MLGDPAVQAVVLATPHSLHRARDRGGGGGGQAGVLREAADLDGGRGRRRGRRRRAGGHRWRRPQPALPAGARAMKRWWPAGELGEAAACRRPFSNENSSPNFAPWRHEPEESPAGGLTGTGVACARRLRGAARAGALRPGPARLAQAGAGAARHAVRAAALRERRDRDPERRAGHAALLAGPCLRQPRQRRDGERHRDHPAGGRREPERAGSPRSTRCGPSSGLRRRGCGRRGLSAAPEEAVATVACFEAIVRSVAAGGAPVAV